MKIICNQKLLANKIGISQKAINGKTTLELLKGILLSAKDGQLKLTGYDLEIGIETYTQAEVIEEGEIVVNARLFGDIIRKLPDSFVEIETDAENNVYINCLNSRFKIKGDSAKEYPRLPEVNEEDLYNIPQDLLKNMIKGTSFAIAQDEARPILQGILFEVKDKELNLVALDGYRLAVRSELLDAYDNIEVVIPGKTLNEVSKILEDNGDIIKITFTNNHILFNINSTKIISRLLDGKFVNYISLLPQEYKLLVNVKRQELQQGIERASLMAKEGNSNLVRLDVQEDILVITSNSQLGKVREEVNINLRGEGIQIAFNSRYLLDVLKSMEEEEIVIELTSSVSPCVIKGKNSNNAKYLVLPVRLVREEGLV